MSKAVLCVSHAALFGIGFIAGKFGGNVPYFQFNREVNGIDAATLILTLSASIVLFRWAEKRKYSDQLGKDVVLERIRSARRAVTECGALLSTSAPLMYPIVVEHVTECRRSYNLAITCIKRYGFDVDEPSIDNGSKSQRILNRLLTDTPPASPRPIAIGLQVSNNVLTIHPDRMTEIRSELRNAFETISELEAQVILCT